MAKWWDERANYRRKVSTGEIREPQPAVHVDYGYGTYTVSNIGTVMSAAQRYYHQTDVYADVVRGMGMIRNRARDEYQHRFSAYLRDQIDQAAFDVMSGTAPRSIERRFIAPKIEKPMITHPWDFADSTFPQTVIGIRDTAERVKYVSTKGNMDLDNLRRVLARYYSDEARVRALIGKGISIRIHPDIDQVVASGQDTYDIAEDGWNRATTPGQQLMFKDGKWHDRVPEAPVWRPIDPETL